MVVDSNGDDTTMEAESSSSTSPAVEKDPALLAEELKEQGNKAFKSMEYGSAIEYYTKAIGTLIFQFFKSLFAIQSVTRPPFKRTDLPHKPRRLVHGFEALPPRAR